MFKDEQKKHHLAAINVRIMRPSERVQRDSSSREVFTQFIRLLEARKDVK